MLRDTALAWIAQNTDLLDETSRAIWEFAELSLAEHKSAALLAQVLEDHGFTLRQNVAGMPTAFVAEYNSGREGPVVGFLGEYDALPELSQAAEPARRPLRQNGSGHGCGHNLLGTGALGAAIATKAAMEAGSLGGAVRYYGCPAEETLVGKVYMVRDGLFSDCDVAITWHPGSFNSVVGARTLAMNSAKFNFHGVTAHAASSPEAGRSALDAVELMNVGVNYLREHVTSQARIHYVITQGGIQPNVVPSYSQVWYYVRAPRRSDVEEIYERVLEIAAGAARMAGVTHDVEFVAGCYDTLPNEPLLAAAQANLEKLEGPRFSQKDKEFARELARTHPTGQREKILRNKDLSLPEGEFLHEGILPDRGERAVSFGSTEVGDVSWTVPTVWFNTACWPIGNAGHSWQNTAAAGTGIGRAGMLFAAKAMALTGLDCLTDEDLLLRAKEEHKRETAAQPYVCPLPDGAVPTP